MVEEKKLMGNLLRAVEEVDWAYTASMAALRGRRGQPLAAERAWKWLAAEPESSARRRRPT